MLSFASDQHLADQLDRVVVGGQDALVGRCAGYFVQAEMHWLVGVQDIFVKFKHSDHTLPLAIRDFYLEYHLFKNYSVIYDGYRLTGCRRHKIFFSADYLLSLFTPECGFPSVQSRHLSEKVFPTIFACWLTSGSCRSLST